LSKGLQASIGLAKCPYPITIFPYGLYPKLPKDPSNPYEPSAYLN